MMNLSALKMYGRFAWGLRRHLRDTITLAEAESIIRRRMETREDSFLRIVEKGVFNNARSPYLPLLRAAGCGLGDVRKLVRTRGLEGALEELRRADIHVTFEEFKGRKAIQRNGCDFVVQPNDFDNPYLKGHYESETGGSTGAGTRVSHDLEHLAAQCPHVMVGCQALGVLNVPMALWRGPLPDGSGINNVLRMAHHGRIPQRWFTVEPQGFEPALRFRLATFVTVAASHVFGSPIPWPEAIPLDQPREIVQWVIRTLEKYGACLVLTQVSRALRICLAARERGADLTGLTLLVGGEPLSPGKFRGITRSGARCVPNYSFAEFGRIGMPCSLSAEPTDVHLLKDALALITHPRTVPGSDEPIHPFCFTTLMPTAPKIMLNVEIDDYGVVEERACGCPMGELGFDVHLRHIHSFSKLTGEGMTLVGSEMVHFLDEVLPARFGGSALDYQLLEEEDREGFTRLSLLVNPRIALQDEQLVVDTMLKALSESSLAADLAGAVWRQAQSIRVKRMTPIWTARGKHFPLRPLKSREQAFTSGTQGRRI